MNYNTKILFSISVVIYFVPVLAFLNRINLPQILTHDLYFIFLFQLFFCATIFILSFILYKIIFKKYLNFSKFFFTNSILFYLLFFFNNLKIFLFDKQSFYFDEIFVLLIYLILYFFLINISKKKINFLIRFVFIFIILQIMTFSINFFKLQITSVQKIEKSQDDNLMTLNTELLTQNLNNENIYFIILDGMMSLDSAMKLKIIKDKNKIIKDLDQNGMLYNENFFSNYDKTYLSISSLLQGSYPVTNNSGRYTSRRNFFPSSIINQNRDNDFFKILRKTNREFYWLGNSWASCLDNIYINCINTNYFIKMASRTMLFYYDSIFIYIFNYLFDTDKAHSALKFFNNFELPKSNNSIYLIHVMSPHPPFFFDKNCTIDLSPDSIIKKNSEVQNYTYAYNCLIDIIKKWSGDKNNNMIFIFGDHGWSFDQSYMNKNEIDSYGNRFKAFFSYKVPTRCNNIKTPNSIINIMRFALICSGNKDIDYIEDLKFQTFSEHEIDYGKVNLIN